MAAGPWPSENENNMADETSTQTKPKRGRPPKDRSALVGQIYSGTFLRIDELAGRNELNKPLVLTTCTAWNKKTGSECGNVTLKRLDQILEGRIVSCDCVRAEKYMGWRYDAASKVAPERCSQIWDASQVMGKKALLAAFPRYQPATLMIIIKWELARVREALADSGEAIWSRMRTLRCCVTVGIEFGLSGTAVRWILSEVEKRHSRPVAQVRPQAAVGAMTRKQELDDNYLWALKRLRATVEDIGWGGGQRREAVFNSKELSFPQGGDFTGSIMRIYWWAEQQTGMDPETLGLCRWLRETIKATRIHRAERRKAFAMQGPARPMPSEPEEPVETTEEDMDRRFPGRRKSIQSQAPAGEEVLIPA